MPRRRVARHEDGCVPRAQHHAPHQKRGEAPGRGGEDDERSADRARDVAEREAPSPPRLGRPAGDEDRRGGLSDDEQPER